MAREIRVTFTDKEEDLYNFIISKSSKSAFLKDLASFEKDRQERILNACESSINLNQVIVKQNNKQDKIEEDKIITEEKLSNSKSKVGGFGK